MLGLLFGAAVFAAASTGEPPPSAVDDEERIEELFNAELAVREVAVRQSEDAKLAAEAEKAAAAVQFPPPSGATVAFEDLGKLIGYPVRVHLGPRARVGSIERVAKDIVTLKSPMGGGYAEFTLNKRQITSIEME